MIHYRPATEFEEIPFHNINQDMVRVYIDSSNGNDLYCFHDIAKAIGIENPEGYIDGIYRSPYYVCTVYEEDFKDEKILINRRGVYLVFSWKESTTIDEIEEDFVDQILIPVRNLINGEATESIEEVNPYIEALNTFQKLIYKYQKVVDEKQEMMTRLEDKCREIADMLTADNAHKYCEADNE